jgi:putative sugar O-methyltransferase
VIRNTIRRLANPFGDRAHPPNDKAERERLRLQQREDLVARRTALRAAKREAEEERAVRKQDARARLDDERRVLDAIAARAYDDYLSVRDAVRRMKEWSGGAAVAYTDGEQRTIDALVPLWDATPDAIARLRRSCEPLSRVRARDYVDRGSDLATRLKRELSMLRRQGAGALFVQESRVLGGFGFEKHGELYNEDTLTFLKALVALHDAAVLQPFGEKTRERRLVWEIGGGWGGFAAQFKTLFPDVTYLITGVPDVLLISAVYLKAVFPQARCRFFAGPQADLFHEWEDADFVFAPERALPLLQLPRLDVTIDAMALVDASVDRVRAHVRRAFDLQCRYFYSLFPPGRNDDRAIVSNALAECYWPHPIPARRERWAPAVMGAEPEPPPDTEEAHLVGWRRMCV